MKTIIEAHVLQNFAPSNLNRDDTGAPKDAWFGGTRRARISSQCSKRAVREYFRTKVGEGGFSADDLAVRTKRAYQAVADALSPKRPVEEALRKAELALSYVKLKAADAGKTQYLLFLGRREIDALARVIDDHWDQIVEVEPKDTDEPGAAGKKKPKSKKDGANSAPKEVQAKIEALLDGGKAVDVALFGRMLADMPEKNQDAACQVAHAISTHAVEREFDFYTAVDDLKPEDSAGADMMGTVEFNSACFYRYAAVDWEQLKKNLGPDTELATKGLRAFLEGFVVAEPTGKQNSFAAHNAPEFVLVTVRRNTAPRNLANAFESAVRVRDELTKVSAERLIAKAGALQAAYGGSSEAWALSLVGAKVADGYATEVTSLAELLDAVLVNVIGG
jgi:CRISPR system Cascade subunit CasC